MMVENKTRELRRLVGGFSSSLNRLVVRLEERNKGLLLVWQQVMPEIRIFGVIAAEVRYG